MQLHLKTPELEARIERWSAETGRPADELLEDAVAGYLDGLAEVRKLLDSRYDDLASGRVRPIDGKIFFDSLRQREDELLKQSS